MYEYQKQLKPQIKQKSNKSDTPVGFFEAIRWTLLICRFVGLLPISGLAQRDSRKSRFSWKTLYTPMYLIVLMAQLFKLVIVTHSLITRDRSMAKISSFLLAYAIFCSMIALIPFSINWRKMLAEIRMIEASLPPFPRKYIRNMNIFMSLMIVAALFEHFIYQAHKYELVLCSPLNGDSGLFIKSYAMDSLKPVYNFMPFSYYFIFLFQIFILQSSFVWTFCDILIINVSIYLIVRFKYFVTILTYKEKELLKNKQKVMQLPWPELQHHYTLLTKLVYILDRNINPFVFFSFSNIIFIGKQIYVILHSHFTEKFHTVCSNEKLDVIKVLYYGFSALFLLTRVALVCSLASRIHTLSRRPLEILYTIPASAYDENFQRLIDQVFHSTVGLSGFHSFYITRQMVLTMLASLFTYELMLLQNVH